MKKLLILLPLSLFLSGCFGGLGGTGGGETNKLTFSQGKVVEGFPGIPGYKNSQVLESIGYQGKYGLSNVTGDKIEKVIEYYGKALGQLGWETSLKKRSATNYAYGIKNEKQKGEMIMNTAADGKKTAISVFIEER
ncbi:hypothetical protein HY382_02100 [Candidatus Curtissbacteria bacterium]|nr:hypothetical protein [Candidatus Curtissbacteria bacterium]